MLYAWMTKIRGLYCRDQASYLASRGRRALPCHVPAMDEKRVSTGLQSIEEHDMPLWTLTPMVAGVYRESFCSFSSEETCPWWSIEERSSGNSGVWFCKDIASVYNRVNLMTLLYICKESCDDVSKWYPFFLATLSISLE